MIIVEAIEKYFGNVHAVRGVSFELAPGQITGLLGPNGAGKTTTIRMIVGYYMPDRGRVLIEGKDTRTAGAAARARVGYMPESTPLYSEMRAEEYLDYRARLFGMKRALRRQRVATVCDRCGLGKLATRRIGALSKGYRQRVGLASALLHDPPVLVLDEPTNGLDPTQIVEVRALVRELSKERTMLVSSHILPEVERLCDRVIVMSGGRVCADGHPWEVGRGSATDSQEYVVECRLGDQVNEALLLERWARVPFVQSIERRGENRGEWASYLIKSKAGGPDLREAIAAGAVHCGALVRELSRVEVSLEVVFSRLLAGEDARGGTGEGVAKP